MQFSLSAGSLSHPWVRIRFIQGLGRWWTFEAVCEGEEAAVVLLIIPEVALCLWQRIPPRVHLLHSHFSASCKLALASGRQKLSGLVTCPMPQAYPMTLESSLHLTSLPSLTFRLQLNLHMLFTIQ